MSAPETIDVVEATTLPKHAIKVLLVDDQAIIGEAVRQTYQVRRRGEPCQSHRPH
jgi:hypothetical protein